MAIDNPVVKASVNKIKDEVRFSASSILINDNGTVRTLQEAWDLRQAANTELNLDFNVIAGVVGSNIPIPEQIQEQFYDMGNTVTAIFENYTSTWMSVTGNTGEIARTYTATFTLLSENYTWADGTKTPKEVPWTILPYELTDIPAQVNIPEFSGDLKKPTFSNYEEAWFEIDSTSEVQTDQVGEHTIRMRPAQYFRWSEALTATLGGERAWASIVWTIEPKKVTVPYQINEEDFNGQPKTPTWNYDYTKYLDIQVTAESAAGTHTAYFTPKTVAVWGDTLTQERRSAYWIINTAGIPKVECDASDTTLVFTGQPQHPDWKNFVSGDEYITVVGPVSERDKGTYNTYFTPVAGSVWTDGTNGTIRVKWKIEPKAIDIPTVTQLVIPTYDGRPHSPTIYNMDSNWVTKTGDIQSLAGTHTVTFSLLTAERVKGNLVWNNTNKTQNPQPFEWSINHKKISKPDFEKMEQNIYYNEGNSVGPTVFMPSGKEADKDHIIIGGITTATEVSGYEEYYTMTFKPATNYCWEDGTRNQLTFSWRILSNPVSLPTIAGTYSYTGKEQTVQYNGSKVDIEIVNDSNKVTNRGTYNVTFKLAKAGSHWAGLTGATATANYTLEVFVDYLYVVMPELTQTVFDYTGSEIDLNDYYSINKEPDLDWITVSGDKQTAINNYETSYSLKGNTADHVNVRWKGTTDSSPKTLAWQIRSPENTFVLSAAEGTVSGVEGNNAFTTFSVTCKGNIGVTVASGDITIAVAEITSQTYNTETTVLTTVVKVTDGGTSGKTNIVITGTDNGGFTAPRAKQFTVTVQPYRALVNCTAKDAERVVKDGKVNDLWSVGDYRVVSINGAADAANLYGISGSIKITFLEYRNNRAYFLLDGGTGNFCGAFYSDYFTHALSNSTTASNYSNSYIRTTILPKFVNLLPTDWRQLLSNENNKTVYYYQESKSVRGNYNTYSSASDYFFVPSYTEIWGSPSSNPSNDCTGNLMTGTPVKLSGLLGGESNQSQFTYFQNHRPTNDKQPQWTSNYENCAGRWGNETYDNRIASKYNLVLRGCLYKGPYILYRHSVNGADSEGIENTLIDGAFHRGSILPCFSLGAV